MRKFFDENIEKIKLWKHKTIEKSISFLNINKNIINKYIFIFILSVAAIFLMWSCCVIYDMNKAGFQDITENYLYVPDLTGLHESDAIGQLKQDGFKNIKVIYIIDQFTDDGLVVKTNYHIMEQVKKEEEIIVYVCDKSLYQKKQD